MSRLQASEPPSGPTELEPLLDETACSRITGRSVASLRRDRLLGQGCPYVKLQGLVKYRPQDLRRYIESNLRNGTHEPAEPGDAGNKAKRARSLQRTGVLPEVING
jgi:hypothetical protein